VGAGELVPILGFAFFDSALAFHIVETQIQKRKGRKEEKCSLHWLPCLRLPSRQSGRGHCDKGLCSNLQPMLSSTRTKCASWFRRAVQVDSFMSILSLVWMSL